MGIYERCPMLITINAASKIKVREPSAIDCRDGHDGLRCLTQQRGKKIDDEEIVYVWSRQSRHSDLAAGH